MTVTQSGPSVPQRGRVLVVDDDAALAEMLGIVLRGEGFDVGIAYDAVTPFFLAGLRLSLETPRIGPFRGRLTAELLAPMTPTTHRIDTRDVWETPPVAATVGLGVSARIP